MEENTKKGKVWQIAASFGAILAGAILAFAVAKNQRQLEAKMIVATNFPAYDLARAVVGVENVEMLVPAGTDLHHYEPTPTDLQKITKAKLLVYNGGESETWVDKLLTDFKGETFKMMDATSGLVEEGKECENDDSECEAELDEHIWTSPKRILEILDALERKIVEIDPDNQAQYKEQADDYAAKIKELDARLKDLIKSGKRKILAFGDRFPFAYLVKDYGLEAVAAFKTCAEEAEPDSKAVAELIDKIKAEKIPTVLKLEQSEGRVAKTIAEATGASVKTLNSFHLISREDFEKGKTYLEFWEENLATLKVALE